MRFRTAVADHPRPVSSLRRRLGGALLATAAATGAAAVLPGLAEAAPTTTDTSTDIGFTAFDLPSTMTVGETELLRVGIYNYSDLTAKNAILAVNLPPNLKVAGTANQRVVRLSIGDVPPGDDSGFIPVTAVKVSATPRPVVGALSSRTPESDLSDNRDSVSVSTVAG